MGDHERADSMLGSKIAWPGGVCDSLVCSWRWGTSASGALDGNEGPWEASCRCWINSVTQSASKASPLKIDTLCLEGIYPQKVMRFSQLIFGPRNVPPVEQNIVSFGLNSSSRRGKDGQRSMNEGLLYSPKKRKFD